GRSPASRLAAPRRGRRRRSGRVEGGLQRASHRWCRDRPRAHAGPTPITAPRPRATEGPLACRDLPGTVKCVTSRFRTAPRAHPRGMAPLLAATPRPRLHLVAGGIDDLPPLRAELDAWLEP